jgi:hypothetical protein
VPTIEAEYTFSFLTAKEAQSFSYWLFQNGCNKSLWGVHRECHRPWPRRPHPRHERGLRPRR